MVKNKEIAFITTYVVLMVFLSLKETTTVFIFPKFGEELYNYIVFYKDALIALLALIGFKLAVYLAMHKSIPKVEIPDMPPFWSVALNYIAFFVPFYLGMSWLFQGQINTIPKFQISDFGGQNVVAFSENFIAFILLPCLLSWGDGQGSVAKGTIIGYGGRQIIKYDIPNWNRFKNIIPSVLIITLLHVGAYSAQTTDLQEFYLAMGVNFFLFLILGSIYLTFGFGAAESGHASWNLILTAISGSII